MNSNLKPLLEAYDAILEEDVESNPTTKSSFRKFINKRAQGAAKIAEKAKEKAGYSTLTAIHFEAKAAPYANAVEWAFKPKERDAHYKSKVEETYKKLSDISKLSQEEFQKLMGELEVWGEVYIRSSKPDSLKI